MLHPQDLVRIKALYLVLGLSDLCKGVCCSIQHRSKQQNLKDEATGYVRVAVLPLEAANLIPELPLILQMGNIGKSAEGVEDGLDERVGERDYGYD